MGPVPRDPRRSEGRALLGALFGATLLLGAGFAVGLVVGASFEEPAILMGHYAGQSQEVAAPEPVLPETAALPEEPAGVEAGEPQGSPLGAGVGEIPAIPPSGVTEPPPAETRPEPKRTPPPAVAAAPPPAARGGFAVQVGAFRERPPADDLTRRLSRSGFKAYVVGGAGGDGRWRVRVGPVASRRDADRLASRLKREKNLPTWVVADGG